MRCLVKIYSHGRLTFIILLVVLLPVFGQSQKADSLRIVLGKIQEDSVMVVTLNALSEALVNDNPSEAISYGEKAKSLAGSLHYARGLAYALKNIGIGYYHLGDYVKVFENWHESLRIFESISDTLGIANIVNNLGVIYFNQGENDKAIEYYLRSLQISESLGNEVRIATALVNVGSVYASQVNTYNEALQYYWKALPLANKLKDNELIGTCTDNMGDIYLKLNKLDSAQYYLEQSLIANANTIYLPYSLNLLGEVLEKEGKYVDAIKMQTEAYNIAKALDSKHEMAQSLVGLGNSSRGNGDLSIAHNKYSEAIALAGEIGSKSVLKDAYGGMAITSSLLGDYKEAYKFQALYSAIKDTIFNIETDDKIKRMQFIYEMGKKQVEIDLLTKDKQLQELKTKRVQFARNAFLVGFFLLVLIAIIIYRSYKHKAHLSRLLDKQNVEIEKLLLNILPTETARELQQDGYATPRDYKSVSVLFSDFKEFTRIAEGLKPHELIAELNSFFNAFDDIIEKYHLEKIKTIGDAYMCAGGIPVANETHPHRIARAGLAIQEFMNKRNEQRSELGLQRWELRIGIHTGPIVAGVVGRKKYAYDIWGDTVNIASRMESNGEIGKVNISVSTYELIKDQFECTYRGKIEAKNKGFIDMYFLEKEKIHEPIDEWSDTMLDQEN